MWDKYAVWVYVLTVVDTVLASGVTIHAVLWKRDSRAVIGWVGLAWLAPFVGSLAYVCLGINRIERKAVSLKLHDPRPPGQHAESVSDGEQQPEAFHRKSPDLHGLARVGHNLTGQPLVPGNRVEPLIDGDQAYPAMLEAISAAKRSVTLLSYIFDSDRAGDAFLEALVAAQQRSVQVRVLIDDVGSKYSRPNMVRRLKKCGGTAARFLPTRLPFPVYANLRNHRKLLVVDGRIGFTGGTNIREGHWLALQPKVPVQCLHFKLDVPIVSQLQKVFVTDWAFASGETLVGEDWFAPETLVGDVWARGIEHGPDQHFEKMADVIAAGLASAKQQV